MNYVQESKTPKGGGKNPEKKKKIVINDVPIGVVLDMLRGEAVTAEPSGSGLIIELVPERRGWFIHEDELLVVNKGLKEILGKDMDLRELIDLAKERGFNRKIKEDKERREREKGGFHVKD